MLLLVGISFHAGRTASRPHPETPKPHPETPPQSPTPKSHPETLKSPNRGVCVWKCLCCGVPRFHAGRTSSRPHPKPLKSLRGVCMWKCPCCGVPRFHAGRMHHDPTPKPHPETPKPYPETPPRSPTPKPHPETLKSPNRGVCMWKCPCCGVPRFHAGRMSSRPHPESPPRNPETLPRNPTPKPHPWRKSGRMCKWRSRIACMCKWRMHV